MRRNARARRTAISGSCIILLAAVVVAVFGAEIYVRLTSQYGYVTPESLKSRSLLYSTAVFAKYIFPQQEHRVLDQSGQYLYSINALGYRGALFTPHKPADKVRIMVYGGSSVFDVAHPDPRDWPHRVETRLQQSGFASVEVINAGIPGLRSSDSVGRLFAEGHLFEPDYVLFYGSWNDIKDFRATEPLLWLRSPLHQSDVDHPLFTYRNDLDRWLCKVSQLYVRLRSRYYTWGLRLGPQGTLPEGNYVSTLSETALRQYRMNIQTFVDVARNAGAVPILMTEARLVSPGNTAADKERIGYDMVLLTHETLLKAFEATDWILRDVAMEKQVRLIDASSDLSGRADLFLDTVHLTDRGSDALADIVAASLEQLLTPPRVSSDNLSRPAELGRPNSP